MSATAIYLISEANPQQHSVQSLVERLLTAHNPTPLPPWFLEHRLYRATTNGSSSSNSSTTASNNSSQSSSSNSQSQSQSDNNSSSQQSQQQQPRYHHVLALSHHPRKAYAYISGANVITLPASQANALNGLLSTKMALMWTPRGSLAAQNGAAYEIAPGLTVRLADLRQIGQQGLHRGVVVCIQAATATAGGASGGENGSLPEAAKIKVEDGKEGGDGESTKDGPLLAKVKTVWESLGVQNAKEFVFDPAVEGGEDSGNGEIKVWCDALRLRG